MTSEPMKLWHFRDAPREYQELSTNGGDEDWVLWVPPDVTPPWWAEDGNTQFAPSHADEYELDDGSLVLIGCHA